MIEKTENEEEEGSRHDLPLEVEIMGLVKHPNIMNVHEILQNSHQYFIISNFIGFGESLHQHIQMRKKGGLPPISEN